MELFERNVKIVKEINCREVILEIIGEIIFVRRNIDVNYVKNRIQIE